MLAGANLSTPDLEQLSGLLVQALSQLQGDPRSFAQSMGSVEPIARIVMALDSKNISNLGVLSALRQYLVSNYSDLRCGEITKPVLPEGVRAFNRIFHARLQNAQIPAISDDEVKNFRGGPSAPVFIYWETQDSKRLLMEAQALRFGGGPERLTVAERSAPEWSVKEEECLTDLEGWTGDNEPSRTDYLDEKSILYMGLLELLPNPTERFKLIHSYVNFLEWTSPQITNRMEWFMPARSLLWDCKAAHDCQDVIQAFLASRDPTLHIYARLEQDTGLMTKQF